MGALASTNGHVAGSFLIPVLWSPITIISGSEGRVESMLRASSFLMACMSFRLSRPRICIAEAASS